MSCRDVFAPRLPVSYSVSTSTKTLAEPFPDDVKEVFESLESLRTNDDLYFPGERRPSEESVDWAKNVLLRVLPRRFLLGARIDPFQSEIHVNWEGSAKRVVAFLPAPNQLKIYREMISGTDAVDPVLNPTASPADLRDTLTWFFER